jgi:hypothetical protein
MHRIPSHSIIVDTCRIDELAVEIFRQHRIGQLAEELLQQSGNTVDIMLEGFGIAEINLARVCGAS